MAEADESDGAFLVYHPQAALVTNVDADHLDVWGTEEAYHAAFADFVRTMEPHSTLVVCGDDPGARALLEPAREHDLIALSVGEGPDARLARRRRPTWPDRRRRSRWRAATARTTGSPCGSPGATTCSTPRPPW